MKKFSTKLFLFFILFTVSLCLIQAQFINDEENQIENNTEKVDLFNDLDFQELLKNSISNKYLELFKNTANISKAKKAFKLRNSDKPKIENITQKRTQKAKSIIEKRKSIGIESNKIVNANSTNIPIIILPKKNEIKKKRLNSINVSSKKTSGKFF